MNRLPHQTILAIHAAVTTAGVAQSRTALLSGLDPRFVDTLPFGPDTSSQILSDLSALNRTGPMIDGSDPLAIWIANGITLLGPRSQVATLEDALAALTSRPTASSLSEHEQDLPNDARAPIAPASSTASRTRGQVEEYLASVRDYCASLPYLSLHDIRPSKTLSETYVALRARDPSTPGGGFDKFGRPISNEVSIADALADSKGGCTIVSGDPGSGKSSLLRHLAERAWEAPASIGLRKRHLPLLIPLPHLASLTGPFDKRICTALEQELSLTQALPPQFFHDWPKETNTRWLLLLDALDEVPTKSRGRFLQWLSGTLGQLSPHRFVLTTRTSSYRAGDLPVPSLRHYEILPFTPQQITEFSTKWFGPEATEFLEMLRRTNVGDLQHTPLLLAIAAKVYIEYKDLPARRSRLYKNFINISLSEARQRGIDTELGERVTKVATFALSTLALRTLKVPDNVSEETLIHIIAEYLQSALGTSRDESTADAQRFMAVMARRSGLLIRRGKTFGFTHPTLQEYLAAEAIVHDCQFDIDALWERCVSRWHVHHWREVALFALGILSEAGRAVDTLILRVLPNMSVSSLAKMIRDEDIDSTEEFLSPEGPLMFATEAIRDGINLDMKEYDRVAEYYLAIIQHLDHGSLMEIAETASSPFNRLAMLRASDAAATGLRELTRSRGVDGYVRHRAMESLLHIRGTTDDLALLTAWGVGTAALFSESTSSFDAAYSARTEIAQLLSRLSERERALRVLSSLIRDRYAEDEARGIAIERWTDLVYNLAGQEDVQRISSDVRFLVRDATISFHSFEQVVGIIKRYRFPWAKPILEQLALDEGADDWRRCEAAIALTVIGDIDSGWYVMLQLAKRLNDSYARHYISEQISTIAGDNIDSQSRFKKGAPS